MLTLGLARNASRIRRIAGLCSDSDEWLGYFNDSVRMLANRGDFYGTVKKIRACMYGNCIVWPRQVSTILAIDQCNSNIRLSNHWAEFDSLNQRDLLGFWGLLGFGGVSFCGQYKGIQGDTACVFNPINSADGINGVYLRFYPTQPTDTGKMVTVFGVDSNGEELRSLHLDGTIQDGIETPLAIPFATMPASDRNVNTVRHVTRIVKDETDGPLYCYQYRATDNVMLDLARYEASETNPEYQTTRLTGNWCIAPQPIPRTIMALVKLQHIDAVNDNDTVIIDNLDAIALAMQGLKFSDSYDSQQSVAMQALAVKELNLELRRRLPLDQIPITLSPFGTANPGRHCIGKFT